MPKSTKTNASTQNGKSRLPRKLEDLEKQELIGAIKMVPDLDLIPYVASMARSTGLSYPLKNHDDLKPLFGGRSRIVFEGHTISWKQACKYFREEFFPIPDELHLLSLVRIALAIRQTEIQVMPKEWPELQRSGGKKNG